MADISVPLGLEMPVGGELHSRAMLNRNSQRVNDAITLIDYTSCAYKDTNWDGTICKFTRVRVGSVGIVIADIVFSLKAVALPVNTAAPIELAGFIPAGFNGVPGASLPMETTTTANSGQGTPVNVGLRFSDKTFLVRSAGAAFTTVAGSTITWHCAYRWDGSLT